MSLILEKYGISSAGFTMPSNTAELFDSYKSAILQALPQIDLSSGSIFNLFLNAHNNVLFNLLEQFEGFYYSKDPSSAVGSQQDSLYAINDVERLSAASSVVSIICTGENSTIIKANSQISNPSTGDLFVNEKDEIISTTACIKILLTLSSISDNTPYNLGVNGFYCGIMSGTGSTSDSIINALVTAINAEVQNIHCTAVNNGSGVLQIVSNNLLQTFSIALSSNFIIGKVSSVFIFQSVQTGKILVNANTITQINTLTTGWDSCYNPSDGQFGRNIETDQAYRERQAKIGIYNRASSTYNAILNAFNDPEQISGISYANLQINDGDIIDANGLPSHSVQLIVSGGSDLDVANLLWTKKGGGIQTFGNTSVLVKDIDNNIRVVKFSRPVNQYVWIKVTTTAGGGYSLPTDYVTQIQNWILIYGTKLKIGDNVMLNIAAAFALANVQGLENLQLTATTTSNLTDAPQNYVNTDIAIGTAEVAVFNIGRISVV